MEKRELEMRTVCEFMLIVLLIGILTSTFSIQPVKASETIYIKADGSIDPPTAPIQRDGDIYTITDNIYDEIVGERSNIVINGNGYTLQGSGSGNGFHLDNVSNVTIKNTNIKGFSNGVYLYSSSNNILFGNNISACTYMGIYLKYSSNNTVSRNNVNATINYDSIYLQYSSNFNSISSNNLTNNRSGVHLSDSSNNSISGNRIAENNAGVWLRGSSTYNCIEGNNITANGRGILLSSHYNSIKGNNVTANYSGIQLGDLFEGSADYNRISENSITANDHSIVIEGGSSYNEFYHNNFIDNTPAIIYTVVNGTVVGTENTWDDGYPSGGNYWSDYEDKDQFSGIYQNETGSDGIGDTPYIIEEFKNVSNIDYHPLMGMFSDFNATSEHHVQTICNSTISDFQFNGTAISFDVTGENGTTGFCRICVPTTFMNDAYKVFVNGTEVPHTLLPCSNSTHSYLYFTYNHSTQEVIIIPEFPSAMIFPLFIIFTLVALMLRKKRGMEHPETWRLR